MPPGRPQPVKCDRHDLWIEWLNAEAEKFRAKESRAEQTWKRAAYALSKCPIEIQHPSELIQLTGIGPKITEYVTQRHKEYCISNGIPFPEKRMSLHEDHDGKVRQSKMIAISSGRKEQRR